jgi:hypothetical protein
MAASMNDWMSMCSSTSQWPDGMNDRLELQGPK